MLVEGDGRGQAYSWEPGRELKQNCGVVMPMMEGVVNGIQGEKGVECNALTVKMDNEPTEATLAG